MAYTHWTEIQKELKTQLPSHTFHSFVEPADCTNYDGDELNLSFSDGFSKENFEEKCLPALKEILRKTVNPNCRVALSISDREEPPTAIKTSYAVPSQYEHPRFDPKYRFTNFVVGSSNQFAHAACEAVSKQPGRCYNPLFIFGRAGLGKTHLLKAIGNEACSHDRNLKVIYATTETFTNELIQSIRTDKMREFREKYRSGCDVLLIDDIHFLAGKDRTQEEFFYTFNYLHELRKQIVVTSDRYPKDIQGLEARLQTRFEWGLVADVQPPEIETRVAILKNKAEEDSIPLPDEVAEYIASHVKHNIRELEGALHRLQAYASLTGARISLELAEQIFRDITPKKTHEIKPEGIMKQVAITYNVTTRDLRGDTRIRRHSHPRQVCMYLIRKYTDLSLPDIGRIMGGKDHTTIMHGVQKIAERLRTDNETIRLVTEIEGRIRS